jgi:hypothetical protein
MSSTLSTRPTANGSFTAIAQVDSKSAHARVLESLNATLIEGHTRDRNGRKIDDERAPKICV